MFQLLHISHVRADAGVACHGFWSLSDYKQSGVIAQWSLGLRIPGLNSLE
jgi:hypothetical protein